jgi:endonuclease/exonuclease/phosphatase family metal-dependent hydrolase
MLKVVVEVMAVLPEHAPVIVGGDFNDWRQRADALLVGTGLHEVFVQRYGVPAKSFPARWPLLRLDRIYVRNAATHRPRVLSNRPWSHLSDHAPLAVEVNL